MDLIEGTPKNSIFFEDVRVIVALAFEPLTKGHSVVIWKEVREDIHELNTEDYEYLMDVVEVTRDSLRKMYGVEKVYVMYLDEVNWVHWHLVPRYDEKGFNVLKHTPETIHDFEDAEELRKIFNDLHKKMMIER